MPASRFVSVVVPMFNEQDNVPLFYPALLRATEGVDHRFEVVFVDDGSRDDTVKAVKKLRGRIPVRLVQLSRNFGKEVATSAGLHAAKGEAVIMVGADLQHPLELIPTFVRQWQEGADVVVGVRQEHAHANAVKSWGSRTFYWLMGRISDTDITPNATDYRLLDRVVVREFARFTERQRITRGLIDWLGFRKSYVPFAAREREHGTPSYNTAKLVKLALGSVTSHSLLPLKLTGYLGALIVLVTVPAGILIGVEKYALRDPYGWGITGTATLALIVLFLVGVVLVCLGLIAMYIANIHGEVTNRPLYVVREEWTS